MSSINYFAENQRDAHARVEEEDRIRNETAAKAREEHRAMIAEMASEILDKEAQELGKLKKYTLKRKYTNICLKLLVIHANNPSDAS